ncbi:MAG: DNA alkylation response protein [Alphaproteobacteria bacterium]|jgi:putative acyl-CoA dehydrogenase|nr:DNA alkylation response protein [Alphaproteobacteria bacterium]MBU0802668.1 DNA alkylation response protein [Alphaproteobacteria bacterium]MBU0871465.1 DNA alkylation response protein [Alphaproteobacteria bacterium]MBU1400132.1 DNA alkylation response protein [Alphaproteobacteria bacterium]MBU1591252.1 DNA alkylation response protein [Alphaproteobacteria bacterium]
MNQEGQSVTHEVTNQPPPLTGSNAWRGDPLLIQIAEEFTAPVRKDLDGLGRFVLTPEAQELARLANTETPILRTHDRQGNRIDVVEFHPAYHALMRRSMASGLHSSVWENGADETGRRHQVRAARFYLTAQLETGHLCPITMTNASLAALMASPKLFREWAPRITRRKYDQSQKPPVEKTGLTLGMGMTEKQGGTDVRANTTRAERTGNGFYRLTGHKWFMSAPMSDAFLVLAQAGEGLSAFLVPRLLGDGSGNGFRFQRLKDKLGNRSNASSEVEFVGAIGEMVGEPGAGIKTIMDMVTLTRLDCAIASSGLMRAGLAEAVQHTRHRTVFGKKLADQTLMQRVLADMALDVAGATALSFRLARSFDEAASNRAEASFARAMTPVVKYWVCKIAPALLYEAMECLGGNGYVEEAPLARYYREAPVNAIWEGSGNVMALDVLRVLERAPALFEEVLAGIEKDLGQGGPGTVAVLRAAMQVAASDEGSARILTEQLALSAAAAELKRMGAGRIADAFIETRLAGQWRTTYGMIDARHDARLIIDTLYPPTN